MTSKTKPKREEEDTVQITKILASLAKQNPEKKFKRKKK